MRSRQVVVVASILLCLLAAAPSAHAAFPGTNGIIAFQSNQDDSDDLFVTNPDGTGQTKLPSDRYETDDQPAWSPDGTKIAFTSNRYWETSRDYDIYVMNVDGTGLTNLTNDTLRDDVYPAWSPDGTKLAFVRSFGDNGEIFVMNANGTGQTNITNDPGNDVAPAWSPDGTKIAFDTNREVGATTGLQIYSMNPDGSGQTSLSGPSDASDSSPDWSPDGSKIAFDRRLFRNPIDLFGPADIWLMNPDGSGQTRLTADDQASQQLPAWSPDGTKLAFSGTGANGRADLFTMNAAGSGAINLTNSSVPDELHADWQPIPINAYARPKGATPTRVSLVPAFRPCSNANRQHGAPLSYGSCAPPQQVSAFLTIGIPPEEPANSVAFVTARTVVGNSATAQNEADLQLVIGVTDVRHSATLSDYSG
jgi:Tol biopolymer transport system component